MTAEQILREFMADVEAVGVAEVGREWPDLLVTYNKARLHFADAPPHVPHDECGYCGKWREDCDCDREEGR